VKGASGGENRKGEKKYPGGRGKDSKNIGGRKTLNLKAVGCAYSGDVGGEFKNQRNWVMIRGKEKEMSNKDRGAVRFGTGLQRGERKRRGFSATEKKLRSCGGRNCWTGFSACVLWRGREGTLTGMSEGMSDGFSRVAKKKGGERQKARFGSIMRELVPLASGGGSRVKGERKFTASIEKKNQKKRM